MNKIQQPSTKMLMHRRLKTLNDAITHFEYEQKIDNKSISIDNVSARGKSRQFRKRGSIQIDNYEMILHGVSGKYKINLKITNNGLTVGEKKLQYKDIYEIKQTFDISSYSFHGDVDQNCCMVLVTNFGSMQLQLHSQALRDQFKSVIMMLIN